MKKAPSARGENSSRIRRGVERPSNREPKTKGRPPHWQQEKAGLAHALYLYFLEGSRPSLGSLTDLNLPDINDTSAENQVRLRRLQEL